MNIYLSAQWGRRGEIEGYAERLRALGHTVTSRWHVGAPMGNEATAMPDDWRTWATADLEDVQSADWLIAFTEPKGTMSRGGRHVEWGYMLGVKAMQPWRTLVFIGPLESQFYALADGHYETFAEWEPWTNRGSGISAS